MEAYVKRTYAQKNRPGGATNKYPFWDYRSRRGSLSTSASNSSNDGSSISSIGSLRSEAEGENISLSGNSDIDSIMLSDPYRLTVHFLADSHEVYPMMDMYQPVIDWVDPDLHIFKVSERINISEQRADDFTYSESSIPSTAVMIFLHEEGMLGCERIQTAKIHFEKSPWNSTILNKFLGDGSIHTHTTARTSFTRRKIFHCGLFDRCIMEKSIFGSDICW
nr:protein FAM124A [Crassostrea gigas]